MTTTTTTTLLTARPAARGRPNGHSHCQQLLLGASEVVPVAAGDLVLGRWQRLFLVELDRGRDREVVIQLVGEWVAPPSILSRYQADLDAYLRDTLAKAVHPSSTA